MATNLHVGDIGAILRVTLEDPDGTAVDISEATTRQFILGRPDGTTLTVTASFDSDGSDGKLVYATVDGDLDQAGSWQLQARVVTPSFDLHSDIGKFKVKTNVGE